MKKKKTSPKKATLKTNSMSVTITETPKTKKAIAAIIKLQDERLKLEAKNARLQKALRANKVGSSLHKANMRDLKKVTMRLRDVRAKAAHKINALTEKSGAYTKKYNHGATIKASNLKISKSNLTRDAGVGIHITFGFVSQVDLPGSDGNAIDAGTVIYRTITEGSIVDFMDDKWGLNPDDYEIQSITKEVRK